MTNQNRNLRTMWCTAEATGEPMKLGRSVFCDYCDTDYTDKSDIGGFIFGSHACCPSCATRMLSNIKGYKEEHHIKARCPSDMSFADFVRQWRGPDAFIQISTIPGDSP